LTLQPSSSVVESKGTVLDRAFWKYCAEQAMLDPVSGGYQILQSAIRNGWVEGYSRTGPNFYKITIFGVSAR
jgi:hypothetical protein